MENVLAPYGTHGTVAKQYANGSILACKDTRILNKATYVLTRNGPNSELGDVQKIASKPRAHHSAKMKMGMLAGFRLPEEVHRRRLEVIRLYLYLKLR